MSNIQNTDIANMVRSVQESDFYTKNMEFHKDNMYSDWKNTPLLGRIAQTKVSDLVSGYVYVSVPALNDDVVKAYIIVPFGEGGPNNSASKPTLPTVGTPVMLMPIPPSGYVVLGSNLQGGRFGEEIAYQDKPIPLIDDRENPFSPFFDTNILHTYGFDAKVKVSPIDLRVQNPNQPYPNVLTAQAGNLYVEGTNGATADIKIATSLTMGTSKYEIYRGYDMTSADKANFNIKRSYTGIRKAITNGQRDLYKYIDGKILPIATVIERYTSFGLGLDLNLSGQIQQVLSTIKQYLEFALSISDAVMKILEFNAETLFADIAGLLSLFGVDIKIPDIVNVAIDYFNMAQKPLSDILMSFIPSTGIGFVDSLIQGVADALFDELFGQLNIFQFIGIDLGIFGKKGTQHDDPEVTFNVNRLTQALVSTGKKTAQSVLGDNFVTDWLFGGNSPQRGSSGRQNLESTYATPLIGIDINNVNVNPKRNDAKLAIILTKLGIERGGMLTQYLLDLNATNSLIYYVSILLMFVDIPKQVEGLAGLGYVTSSSSVMEGLAYELLVDEVGPCNRMVSDLVNIDYTDKEAVTSTLEDNFAIENPTDFDLWSNGVDSVLEFFEGTIMEQASIHLADGKLLSFLREVIKIETTLDIIETPATYQAIKSLIIALFPQEIVGYDGQITSES